MDKYELVFDIIEHPENYTSDRLTEIMSDPETTEIYNTICMTDSAVGKDKNPDVDTEWKRFSEKHPLPPRRLFKWLGNRAASITAIICTSLVAVAAGIAVTFAVTDYRSETAEPSGETSAGSNISESSESIHARNDSVSMELTPIIFENSSLESILNTVSAIYDVRIIFRNKEAASLHLYYKLNPALPLDEIVSQLSTFEQINITYKNNTLIID